ncbi:proteasome activator subunit 4 [Marchantia polymorpha subsp. ruderalis]|uniref:Proteasome activator subunit 4 n=2 Tax=Marchantia polymorpha TaxID=3197 RepID=A0AAF6BIS5_MARPO|nr:hypothetical protein MARPO_0071s0029 [Marchantia polymorpha]BBN11909.1 hypothetical protein Mp_5g15810 [Marchantia polymorpha subsp. ruderalis]|eukprot:PTQ35411.1 hypothetical protein MARPO_0071s0029 [Marchantia polymorpha]
MHVYNAWLPPPVRELLEADPERNKFHDVVLEVEREWQLHSAESRFASLKWISVINTFVKARAELAIEDLELLVKRALDILLASSDNLFVQIQWSRCLVKILKKYRNSLSLIIQWKPFYRLIYDTHFKRRISYEGLALKQYHQDTIVSLVRTSRRFFPAGSVTEIWEEFRPALDDLSHNSALEAVGFISLFMPTKLEKLTETDRATLSSKWLEECLKLWAALPNSHYWDRQWASLLSRFIKHCYVSHTVDLDPYLPTLFTHILRSFEVPVGKSGTSSPVGRDISREIMFAFNGGMWAQPVSKYYAKAIVYMLKPGGPTEYLLSNLIDLLEQYYHPSNGGSWTTSLERFLHFLVYYFQKRLAFEQRSRSAGAVLEVNSFLGSAERRSFVKTLLPLIERGQYSKDSDMSETAASTASMLTYLEPSLVLPLINSRFHTALNTITATHQLESAVTTLALAARPTFLACAKEGVFAKNDDNQASSLYLEEFTETLVVAMFSTLLGMDANDPPKTLATMALYSSILCNVGVVGDVADGGSLVLPIDWSEWLDEFLSRLFTLLVHLEPSGQQLDTGLDDGYYLSSSTFLMQEGSFYHSVIELLFGRLTKPLYLQALKKLAQFLQNNVLPGAALEIGLLCSFAVFTNSAEAISQLLVPIMNSLVASLGDFPTTGFGGDDDSRIDSSRVQATLSQAVETSVTFQLNVLSAALMFAGENVLPYKALLDKVIFASFNAPSSKVNEAGNRLLSSLLGSLIFYYPLDQYKLNSRLVDGVEAWISTKISAEDGDAPHWHIPNKEELSYANALLDQHLRGAVSSLRDVCKSNRQAESSGGQVQIKEYLRVLFLRIDATLRGVGSCLPDFDLAPSSGASGSKAKRRLNVLGAFGASVGDNKLREEAADTLHAACEYLFKERADDTVLLMMLIRVMDLVGFSATLEHNFWSNGKRLRHAEAKCLTEPKMNFITNPDAKNKRRPRWLVVDMVSLHNAWRSSRGSFRPIYAGPDLVPVSKHLALLAKDLLKLSLHRYDVVRKFAISALGKSLKRFPILVKDCLPTLTGSLEDSAALEESALGACKVLMLRPVLRHLTQDWSALSSFFRSLLKSAHHESVKAQSAINELFVVFSVRFGGLPSLSSATKNTDASTYNALVAHIKGMLSDGSENIHWRYNLMANGMLLLLLVQPVSDGSKPNPVLESRMIIAEQFLSNLSSELPALRPLSIIALLCLLQAWSHESLVAKAPEALKAKKELGSLSLKDVLIPIIQKQGFGGTIIQNLAFDHHYPEGSGRTGRWNGSRTTARISDLGLTDLMPPFTRDWPRTRTWDSGMRGEAFSVNSAKLFKRLARECGEVLVNALRGPLEEVANLPEERGKQCVAAEIIGGLLQSDVKCVVAAWDDWLRPTLQKCLMQATVESGPEWAACIRFSLTGKGGRGESSPVLRYEILECLAEPLPSTASTSLIAKRLMLLRAALVEYRPVPSQSKEGLLHAHLLREMTSSMAHAAPQVRENVGSLMCVLLANIRASSALEEQVRVQISDRMETESNLGISYPSITVDMNKAAVGRPAETVAKLQFIAASPAGFTAPMDVVASGAGDVLMATRGALEKTLGSELSLVKTATVDEFNKVLVEETKITSLRIQSLGGPAFGGSEASTSNSADQLENGSQDIKWMETVLYFIVACLKSGKAVDMTPTLIGLLHPLLSLQETSEKDLSALAKGTLRLLNWHPIPRENLPAAVKAVLEAAADTNWHTRVAALVFIQSFVYRHTYILSTKDKESLWNRVRELLSDPQVEVREVAATNIAGMMKGSDNEFAQAFREQTMRAASSMHNASKRKRTSETTPKPVYTAAAIHGNVLGLAACVLSVPYDMPTWLPDTVTLLGRFSGESSLIKSTVKKVISEFRRTHSDTWAYQKDSFSEEQLEVLSDLTSSASYFA